MDQAKLSWALGELENEYPDPNNKNRKMITALLTMWNNVAMMDNDLLDDEAVLDDFASLIRGKSLKTDTPEEARAWAPASQYATYSSRARVRPDYDTGADGWKLNGREGEIITIRRGELIVRFDEELPGAPAEIRAGLAAFDVDISHLKRKDEL